MTEPITAPPITDPTSGLPIVPDDPVYNATLVRRVDETESLAYFWVRFDGEPTPFEAGQYMTIGVMVDEQDRPAAVLGRLAAGGRRDRGLRVLRPPRPGRDVHAAAVATCRSATGCG